MQFIVHSVGADAHIGPSEKFDLDGRIFPHQAGKYTHSNPARAEWVRADVGIGPYGALQNGMIN